VDALLGVPGTAAAGTIREANCNAVIIQVRKRADVCYPSGVGEPYMSNLSPSDFNALAALIKAAHDTSYGKKRIEVHCWSVAFKTAKGQVYSQHTNTPTGSLTTFDNYWPTRTSSTTGSENADGALDPGHPKCLEYLVNAHMDLVNFETTAGPDGTDGHIDGIHYDYIRFEANTEGYNPTSVARYNARYGLTGDPSPSSEQFKQWRRDQCTAFVRQMYARIQKARPSVKQSGAFVTWNPSPTASTRAAFQATRPYYDVYSDWDSWMQEGILDLAVPMTYYNWASLPTDYTKWMNFEKDRKFNRQLIVGPGIYLNSLENAIYELQMTRDASPAGNYAEGFAGYSYAVPYLSGSWSGFTNSLVPSVTPTWDDIPDMPWKTAPTKGHIMGTVTIAGTGAWADGARVEISGPVSRVQTNDGTGFYAFIDLPVGTYTVTASLNGYPNAVGTAVVAVGQVTGNMYEVNLILGGEATPPVITAQPQSQTVSQGAGATFIVVASGTAPLSYQWRFNAAPIAGATASTYTVDDAQPADAGSYSVIVTNTAGSVTSADAILTVDTVVNPPAITSQPASQTVIAGQGATFTVTASGTAPLSYQWRYNAAPIAGATASTYTRGDVQIADAGSYSVVVTNPAGSVTSADAVLTVHFLLTATATAGGTVSKNPNYASYAPNDVVTLTATPDTGSEFLGWSGDASGTENPLAVTMTGNKLISANFFSTTDIILDNTNAAVTFTGLWETGSATAGKYGPDYRFAVTAVGGLSNAVFRPYIYNSGYYDVYVWYASGSNRATNAPWSIVYDGGSVTVPVNQVVNGGTWVSIGTAIPFVQGTNGYVMLSNDTGYPGKVVMADAVRFTYVGPLETNLTLTATATAGGAVYKHPDQATYERNSVVTLVAAPVLGWNFSGWSGGATGTDNPLTVTLATSLTITANFTSTVPELIVDNTNAVFGGTWTTSTASDDFQANYRYASTKTGTANATATFTPTITTAGNYDVYVWYPTLSSNRRSAAVPHLVSYNGGTANVIVSQQSGFGSWQLIASDRPFAAGTSGFVQLANNTGETSRRVAADAVRWVYSGNQDSAPIIIAQPQSQTADAGDAATFTATAAGTAPLSYQWRFNGTDIAGATASAYTRSDLQSGDAGAYSVMVNNAVGSVASSEAVLTVIGGPVYVAPIITAQPQDQNVNQGGNATFTVSASGTPDPSYQWRFNGADIPGATASNYTRSNVQPFDAGSYSVVVTNLAGTVTSADAVLTVNVAPAIMAQPQDKNVNQGSDAVFSVVGTGTPAPSYQWRKNGTPIGGAVGTSYTVANAQPSDAGSYSVEVSNVAGTVTSADAVLTVNVAPAVTAQPQDQNVNQGSDAVFSVVATGTPAPSYQWRKDGAPIGGATGASYTVANAQSADEGSYSVVVSNIAGTVTSADAVLTVNVAPAITTQPVDQNVNLGSDAAFSVVATGTPAPAYQWRFNGTDLSGETSATLTLASVRLADAGSYSVVVSNIAGTVTSADAVLAVIEPTAPRIDLITLAAGDQIQLQVSGTPGRYAVEATTNLLVEDWVELTNFTTTNSEFQFLDPDINEPKRFYRVRLIP